MIYTNYNTLTINLNAIEKNIAKLRAHLPKNNSIMAVIKANAYGTDLITIAKFLEKQNIEIFCVSNINEAIALKNSGIKKDIFILHSFENISEIVKNEFQLGVNSYELIEKINDESKKQNKKTKVHLNVDTGMKRLGCNIQDAISLAKEINNSDNLIFEGIMSHLAAANSTNHEDFTNNQIQSFRKIISDLEKINIKPKWKHIANSSGCIKFHLQDFNMHRIGLAIFGVLPNDKIQLKEALQLTSTIIYINKAKKGDSIGYDRNFTVKKDEMQIGVIPIGYADGIHRNYNNKGHVFINGKSAPIIGDVCMDFTMIDLSQTLETKVGDKVEFFGPNCPPHSIEHFAQQGNTITHELISCLGPNVKRHFIKN